MSVVALFTPLNAHHASHTRSDLSVELAKLASESLVVYFGPKRFCSVVSVGEVDNERTKAL